MSQRHSKRPQCSHEDCGSRRLHVGNDGFTYCDQGHQQSELGTVVAEDTGELVQHGQTSRRRGDSDAESLGSRVSGFTGPKAFEHYLVCLQLVLRKQLRWMVEVQKLPGELELLVRDLWALQLQKRRERVSYDSETDTEAPSSAHFSSQSEGDTDRETVRSQRSQSAKRKLLSRSGPTLKDALSLIYIGTLILRIPLTVSDFHRWINNGELLYYRAIKELPRSMIDRLPATRQELLEPQNLISLTSLHRCVLDLLSTFHSDFGMVPPPLNDPSVLYRWVRELSLPLEIYVATQRLGHLLGLDFTFTVEAIPGSRIDLRYPEVRLMCLVVIATKLIFAFDDQKRYPKASSDLGALKMDWSVWTQAQSQSQNTADDDETESHLTWEEAFVMTEKDSLTLADDRLDDYLDWYADNLASEELRERGRAGRDADFRRALFRMFPSQRQPSSTRGGSSNTRARCEIDSTGVTSVAKLVQVHEAFRLNRVVPEQEADNIPRAGSSYQQHRSEEELHGASKIFYEKAALLAGISLRGLVRAVFHMERRLMEREKEFKKGQEEKSSTLAG